MDWLFSSLPEVLLRKSSHDTQWECTILVFTGYSCTLKQSASSSWNSNIFFNDFPSTFAHLICFYSLYSDNFPVNFWEHHIVNQVSDTLSLLSQPLYCTGTENSSLVASIKKNHLKNEGGYRDCWTSQSEKHQISSVNDLLTIKFNF